MNQIVLPERYVYLIKLKFCMVVNYVDCCVVVNYVDCFCHWSVPKGDSIKMSKDWDVPVTLTIFDMNKYWDMPAILTSFDMIAVAPDSVVSRFWTGVKSILNVWVVLSRSCVVDGTLISRNWLIPVCVFQVNFWVQREILNCQTLKTRADVLSHFIKIAKVSGGCNTAHVGQFSSLLG